MSSGLPWSGKRKKGRVDSRGRWGENFEDFSKHGKAAIIGHPPTSRMIVFDGEFPIKDARAWICFEYGNAVP